jgi:hypothetical protein
MKIINEEVHSNVSLRQLVVLALNKSGIYLSIYLSIYESI